MILLCSRSYTIHYQSSFSFETFINTSYNVVSDTAQALIDFFNSYSSKPKDYLLSNFLTKLISY